MLCAAAGRFLAGILWLPPISSWFEGARAASVERPTQLSWTDAAAGLLAAIGLLWAVWRLQKQILQLRRDIRDTKIVQDAIIEKVPEELRPLVDRIQKLESHTDISGLRKMLIDRLMEGDKRKPND